MKNGSLGYNGFSNKGNNIGTSYLGSGSESAFKGLGLKAIIESLLPRSRIWQDITRSGADDEIRIAMSGKERRMKGVRYDVSANGRRPLLKYDRARPVKNILSRNIRARVRRGR